MKCFQLLVYFAAAGWLFAEEVILTDFDQPPEDLFDIKGSPYILVSEYSLSRTEPGRLSLLNAVSLQKFVLESSTTTHSTKRSAFADPACVSLPLSSISPHGVDGIRLQDGTFEIAVVNHFEYESIEFYVLDNVESSSPSLTSIGCTRLTPESPDDLHNDVSYRDDGQSLAVTLYQKDFEAQNRLVGQVLVTASFIFPVNGSNLKLIGPGGAVRTILDGQLNLANGVVFVDNSRFFVASNADSVVIQTNVGTQEIVTAFSIEIPDNLVRETESSLLATRVDNANFIQSSLCSFVGLFCEIDFSVVRYNWDSRRVTDVYSSTLEGFVSVALIKDGKLFVGNSMLNRLSVVSDFSTI